MDTYRIGVTLRAHSSWDDAAAATVVDGTGDDAVAWVDAGNPALLRVSLDRPAEDQDAALAAGRALGLRLVDRAPVPAGLLEVSAMTDEDVIVWRAEP